MLYKYIRYYVTFCIWLFPLPNTLWTLSQFVAAVAFSSALNLGFMRQKKIPGILADLLLSPHISESYAYPIYKMFKVLSFTLVRIRERISTPSSQKQKSVRLVFQSSEQPRNLVKSNWLQGRYISVGVCSTEELWFGKLMFFSFKIAKTLSQIWDCSLDFEKKIILRKH